MHTIDTYCGGCKTGVTVTLSDAVLLVPDEPYQPALSFLCPDCGSRRVLPCSEDKATILLRWGITAQHVALAVPSYHKPGPPISFDDILDFHAALGAL